MPKTPAEIYDDWLPFIEAGRPLPPDIELYLEENVFVPQIANKKPGTNAGTPAGVAKVEPLIKRPPPRRGI